MLKNTLSSMAIALSLLLSACAAPTEQVMPPLQYHQTIPIHSNKTAYLYWQSGSQYADEVPNNVNYSDPLAAVIGTAIDGQLRKNNPGRYTYSYGNAQQAVFMTSFKHILLDQHVFKRVELVTAPQKLGPNDVLLIIKFRSTRISNDNDALHTITLTVDMTIKDADSSPFARTYVVHNNPPESVWKAKSFQEQQTEVSEKLLSKIMASLTEWHKKA